MGEPWNRARPVVTLLVKRGTDNWVATSNSSCSARSSSEVSMVRIGWRELMSSSNSSRLPGLGVARGAAILSSFQLGFNLFSARVALFDRPASVP